MELVVGEDDDGDRRIPEVIGQIEPEPVVVDENGVQVLVEQLLRHRPFELVEPQIQEFQLRQLENHSRELSGEPIVAQIELEQQLEAVELVRNSSTEPVGVDVEQCEIREQPELLRQVPGNVAVVEVDPGHGPDRSVVERLGAENSGVIADIRSHPIARDVERVGENGLLQRLQRYVSVPEPVILEDERGVDGHELAAVAELVAVVKELAVLDVEGFLVGESSMADNVAAAAVLVLVLLSSSTIEE